MVTAINNDKYLAGDERTAKREIEKDKKFAAAKETLTMGGNAEGVKIGTFNGVSFNSFAAGDANDAALVGAIARSTECGKETVVKGNAGVYLFVVDNINNTEAADNADVEAKRKEMNEARKADANRNYENYILDGVQVVDERGVGEL